MIIPIFRIGIIFSAKH